MEKGMKVYPFYEEREDKHMMDKAKVTVTAMISVLMSWLGILAVPYRMETVSSYKGIRGIIKKVCQWLLVLVGAWIDMLINYAIECAGIEFTLPFVVATIVAVWLVVNEIISILENMLDIGVHMPPFLLPIVKYIRKQVEDKAKVAEEKEGRDYED